MKLIDNVTNNLLLYCALLSLIVLTYVYTDTATVENKLLACLRNSIPSINAALIIFIGLYLTINRLGISKEQIICSEIDKIKEQLSGSINLNNGTKCTYQCDDFILKLSESLNAQIADLPNKFYDETFQSKLFKDVTNLIHFSLMQKRMEDSGISNFYTTRDDYVRFRIGHKLIDFIETAKKEVYIAAHWMAHGTEIEGIHKKLVQFVKHPKNINFRIAIIDPNGSHLKSIANYFGIRLGEIEDRINRSLSNLYKARETLTPEEKERFTIKVYEALPVASIIMIDPFEHDGRLQMDIKCYQVERHNSFGFEFTNRNIKNKLYETCRDSWVKLINDAKHYDPSEYRKVT